ncbi:MAG: Signal peptidase I [Candidatus Collierbacteria bacterium GW2011_GWB1_45_35]|uniref:Signal peptidase I n=1 Tax=Candidatus Collierbacteria bacterium GW2011_GWB2_45_17 TaxID=1618388 RepID=A0A837IMF7_9BACT|nr:MAG: Signal peptidase I [Microgenomates group bacterium GW2011_GWC1_44_23]KKT96251.1 MAG: Signal peptidase I [Candidatus Collierbacteria bacterium GW2011_GWA1_45_15]KKU01291.1 MAG: Signal peptidase I [Candidatus Collierbacteria bacterium GW2011_GWB2_45_17]KKU04995.1 MAG: Signal peptidase I [Candidatus Collierbacteria bacterium GW2011_GWB1_45_35]HBC44986.1 signal peptidase I [Candidatus Collierbacteria bacterium]
MKTIIIWLFGLGFLLGLLITLLLRMWLIVPIYLILTLVTIPPLHNFLSKRVNLKLNRVSRLILIFLLVPLSMLIATLYGFVDGTTTLKKTAQFFADDGSSLYMYPSLYWPTDKGGYDDASKNPAIASDKMIFNVFDLREGYNAGFGTIMAPFKPNLRHEIEKILKYKPSKIFNYSDIVVFNKEVQKDDKRVFIQRVIAKGGDKVRFENGYVYVNGKKIDEPYLAKDQSTYAGIFYNQEKFIKNCEEIIVPANQLFVLGDNRMLSDGDSRNFGTISEDEILGYLPKDYQTTFSKYWLKNNQMKVVSDGDSNELLTYFNQIRQKKGMSNLTTSNDLNIIIKNYLKSAIENNDFSNIPKKLATQKALQEIINRNPIGVTIIEGVYDLDTYKGYLYLVAGDANSQEAQKNSSKFAFSSFRTEIDGCMKSGTIIATFK